MARLSWGSELVGIASSIILVRTAGSVIPGWKGDTSAGGEGCHGISIVEDSVSISEFNAVGTQVIISQLRSFRPVISSREEALRSVIVVDAERVLDPPGSFDQGDGAVWSHSSIEEFLPGADIAVNAGNTGWASASSVLSSLIEGLPSADINEFVADPGEVIVEGIVAILTFTTGTPEVDLVELSAEDTGSLTLVDISAEIVGDLVSSEELISLSLNKSSLSLSVGVTLIGSLCANGVISTVEGCPFTVPSFDLRD